MTKNKTEASKMYKKWRASQREKRLKTKDSSFDNLYE